MDIITKIKNKEDFTYKFADVPLDTTGKLNAGWAEPTFDDFLTRMVKEPVFLNQSTVIPMTSLQHDLDMFDNNIDFETQRPPLKSSLQYGELEDVEPVRNRRQLLAQPLALRSTITQNFLDENIEKEGFLSTWTSYLAAQAGPALERFGIYSKITNVSDWSKETHKSAFYVTNGILAQLIKCYKDHIALDPGSCYGMGKLVTPKKITDGLLENINLYIENDGDLSNATIVLPPQIYSRFISEIASDRKTDLGDILWVEGKTPMFMGMEIKPDHVLRNSPNKFNEAGFNKTTRKYSEEAAAAKPGDIVYGFITKPSNNVFGIMRDTEVKQEYSIDVFGYKVALLAKSDVSILFDQDTLTIPFTNNENWDA